MCGIVGYIGSKEAKSILLQGLKRLEYRGYDSAGVAILNGGLQLFKNVGNIAALENMLPENIPGKCGIAHTRWATHGIPSQINAHPHRSYSGSMVMVHNGIIENYQEIKQELISAGVSFKSDTDTEVLLNLIDFEYQSNGHHITPAIQDASEKIKGTYAIGLIVCNQPNRLYAARCGSPLIIAQNKNGFTIASDLCAFDEDTEKIYFPQDHDLAILDQNQEISFIDSQKQIVLRAPETFFRTTNDTDKNGFRDFMLKEIFEQPITLQKSLDLTDSQGNFIFPLLKSIEKQLQSTRRILILGCGTSWHAGLIGSFLLEKYARIPAVTEYASEFRYRHPVVGKNDLVIALSQSGETADTLAAARLAKAAGATILSVCNVRHSTLTREADASIPLNAGQETGVASTKTFTAQIVVLSELAFYLSNFLGHNPVIMADIIQKFKDLPALISSALNLKDQIKTLAEKYRFAQNFLFIGRGINYPIALEGALKLKEISYIHAEGYPGAEMKHGPIALIDTAFPTVAIVTDAENRLKMISNIHEIKARGGNVIALIKRGDLEIASMVDDSIELTVPSDETAPILSIIPLQLFAYYCARLRGCNIDQPRNLAKSVTVE